MNIFIIAVACTSVDTDDGTVFDFQNLRCTRALPKSNNYLTSSTLKTAAYTCVTT